MKDKIWRNKIKCIYFLTLLFVTSCNKPLNSFNKWFNLDGLPTEWSDEQIILKECGVAGEGVFKAIDVKEIYLNNDENFFYFYFKMNKSIKDQFAKKGGADFLDIYIDIDRNDKTGCKGVNGFDFGNINGYEYELRTSLVTKGHTEGLDFIVDSYYLNALIVAPEKDGIFFFDFLFEPDNPEKYIHDSQEGVELALPIKSLNITKGDTVKFLFVERNNLLIQEGYNQIDYTLK